MQPLGNGSFAPYAGPPCADEEEVVLDAVPPEAWLSSYIVPPVKGTASLNYLGRIPITFSALASVLSGVAVANIAHCDEVVKAIETGTLLQVALATFRACDPGNSGYLKYDDGGIRDLVTTVFRQLRMKAPPESHIFHVFKVFDIRNRNYLTGCECICLVDGVMRAIVDVMLQKTPVAAKGVPNFFAGEECQRQPSGSPPVAAAPPQLTSASSKDYIVGQRVEIFSRSRKRWVEGVVSCVGTDGAVTVLYEDGNNEKTVPQQLIPEILRTCSKEPSSRQATLPSKILPGQQLEIYSSSQDQWMLGEVVSVQEDGSLVVFYGSNSKKTVPPSHFGTAIRAVQAASGAEIGHAPSTPVAKLLQDGAGTPSQSIAEQLHGGGACTPKRSSSNNNSSSTMNAGAASLLKLGQHVSVFSNGQGRWVPGFVVNIDPDGHVTVKYGDTLKTVAKDEIASVIRALPEGLAESASGAAAAGNASTSAYSVGQPVEVYSKSQGRWCLGVVLQVDASYGAVTVQYGETLKTIAKEELQSELRSVGAGTPAVSSTAPPPLVAGAAPQQSAVAPQAAAVAAVPPPKIQEKSPPVFGGAAASRSSGLVLGQYVEVFSQSQNSWRQAQVIMVTLSGAITVQYGTTQKTIAEEDVGSMVRPCHSVDGLVPEAPKIIYDLGEQVEAYSLSQGKWNAGQIIGLCLDGAVVVQYGETQKTIAMEEMPKVLRKGAGTGPPAPWQQAVAGAGQRGGSSICMSALRPSAAPPVAAASPEASADTPAALERRGGGASLCMSAARPAMQEATPNQAPMPNSNAGCSICMSAAAPQDPHRSTRPSAPAVIGDPESAWPGPAAACRGQSMCFTAAVPAPATAQQRQPSMQQEDRGGAEMPHASNAAPAPRDLLRLPAGTRLEARLRDKEGRPTRRYHPCTLEGVNPNGTLRVRFDDGSVNLEMFPEDCEMPGADHSPLVAAEDLAHAHAAGGGAAAHAPPWLASATNAVAAAAAGAGAELHAALQQPEQVSAPAHVANAWASPSPPLAMAVDPLPQSGIQQGEEQVLEAGLLIWMHGLMGSGDEFENLLKATVGQNLPWIQWELPNAPVQAVSCKGGCAVPSWFDVLEMPITNERPHAGLMETVNRVHVMIRRAEMRGILASRVALGGLSQGGVVALAAGLSYERRLACVCALSSWLPGGLLSMRLNHLDTPIMLGHGTEDRTVSPEIVDEAVTKLRQAGCSSVSLQKYPGLGHSVVFDEFTDLEDLLRRTIPSAPAAQ